MPHDHEAEYRRRVDDLDAFSRSIGATALFTVMVTPGGARYSHGGCACDRCLGYAVRLMVQAANCADQLEASTVGVH